MLRQAKNVIINGVTLDEHLRLHNMWLKGNDGKKVNLEGVNLEGVNLKDANLKDANLRGANLEGVNLEGVNLEGANLKDANLKDANLKDANLRGANLDYSCMPLWCGDLEANYDDKQIIQQFYHVLSHVKHSNNASDELKKLLLSSDNLEIANSFHKVDECGTL